MFDSKRADSFYHDNANTLFANIPKELFPLISAYPSQEENAIQLLNHLAFGQRTKAEALIKANPCLLLHACGDILTPSGLVIDYPITAYEFALLSGDDKAATMIKPYFSKIPDGEKDRDEQYEGCRPHIENMMKQKPSYELQSLIDIIKACSDADITAALKHDMKNMSRVLLDAITKFRQHFTPEKMTKPGMHFNYMNLHHAFDIYHKEFDYLSHNGYARCRLVWRQVVGFIMRCLPAYDRQVFARGLFDVVNNKVKVGETFEFENDKDNFFPNCRSDGYFEGGLGFDFGVDLFGRPWLDITIGARGLGLGLYGNLCRAKTSVLQNLCSQLKIHGLNSGQFHVHMTVDYTQDLEKQPKDSDLCLIF